MNNITKFVFIAIGTCFALAGIILFAKKDDKNRNTIKALGFEFSISGSSLVIFILGFALIVFPFTDLVKSTPPDKTPFTDLVKSTPPDKTPSSLASSYVLPPKNVNVILIPIEDYKEMIIKEYEAAKQSENDKEKIRELEAKLAMANQTPHLKSVFATWDPAPGEVTGYRLYFGTEPGNYTSRLDVGNVLEYRIEDLEPGVYYYVVTAYNSYGESGYSEVKEIVLSK